MLHPGQVLGNYEVIEEVGQGGFAMVYRMEHVVLRSMHALKVLRPEYVVHRSLRDRFLNEARVMAQMRHPNIVRATDVISAPGVAGIVMDFIVGGSLADWIEDAAATPAPDFVRQIFIPALRALDYVHRREVVHRDLKPANILLERYAEEPLRPMLVDFGIARVRDDFHRVGAHQTRAGTRMGTIGYMSPEQLRDATAADARSDIFSMGVTLYEFVTLRSPFAAYSNEIDVMQAIVTGDYVIPDGLRRADPILASAIETAMKLDPDARFPTCAAFAEALHPPVRRAPLPSPPTPAIPPARAPEDERPPGPPSAVQPEPMEDADLIVKTTAGRRGSRLQVLGRWLRPHANGPGARLVYRPDTDEAQPIDLSDGRLTIGRASGNDVCLPKDNWVARYHCRLERSEDGVWKVHDNATINGTLVNGELVLERALHGGETLTVGQTPFRFEIQSAPATN
ncbi:MAG: FHA domain-containing serine/threonine-protein kinase [Myxococcota bacterium]